MNRAALMIVMLLSASGCDGGNSAEIAELRANLDVLGKRLDLNLPPGTQVVHVETEYGMDDAIFAKLQIPAAEAPGFIQGLELKSSRHRSADAFGRDHGLWDPHQAKVLRVGSVMLPSSRGLVVGLDDSRSDVLVVYVLNHGT